MEILKKLGTDDLIIPSFQEYCEKNNSYKSHTATTYADVLNAHLLSQSGITIKNNLDHYTFPNEYLNYTEYVGKKMANVLNYTELITNSPKKLKL